MKKLKQFKHKFFKEKFDKTKTELKYVKKFGMPLNVVNVCIPPRWNENDIALLHINKEAYDRHIDYVAKEIYIHNDCFLGCYRK